MKPPKRDMDDVAVLAWADVLDGLTYYQVLSLDFSATTDDVQEAFHVFAERFHPDAHAARPPDITHAASEVFKRGVEAYRVLSNPSLRGEYDDSLVEGDVRPAKFTSMVPPASAPESEIDQLSRVAAARPFIQQARTLEAQSRYPEARLQVDLALMHDPTSPGLQALRTRLNEAITRLRASKAPPAR